MSQHHSVEGHNMPCINRKTDQLVILQYTIANTFSKRLIGFLWYKKIPDYVLYFPKCLSVHTFFMRASIDIVFFDESTQKIVDVFIGVRPWRMKKSRFSKNISTLEFPAHTLTPGDLGKKVVFTKTPEKNTPEQ